MTFQGRIDSPVVAIESVADRRGIIECLKKGSFSLTKDTKSPVIFLRDDLSYLIENVVPGMVLKVISDGKVEKISDAPNEGNVDRRGFKKFVRMELWVDNEPVSFSNPVFL